MREEEVFLAIAGMVAGIIVVRILAQAAIRIFCHWNDVRLKLKLIDAGMSSSEIHAVVNSGSFYSGKKQKPQKPPKAVPDKSLEKEYGYVP
jgi:hypothetical protein